MPAAYWYLRIWGHPMTSINYNYLTLGGIFVGMGLAFLFLVVKFLPYKRITYTITALILLISGVAIIVMAFIPWAELKAQAFSSMLNLNSENVKLLTIYKQNDVDKLIIKSNNKQLLEKWTSILQSCRSFNPNHPFYEDKYTVIVDNERGDRFFYEVTLDKKLPNTADLELAKEMEIFSALHYVSDYRCDGLFEFISEVAVNSKD